MIDQEVDVGEILGGLDQILGMIVVRHWPQRQALVDTDALHVELPGLLEHRIGNCLIVHPPATIESLWTRAGVTLPGIDLEHLRLHRHEVQIGCPQLGRD